MFSKVNDNVKKRATANDVFITPLALAKNHIDLIPFKDTDIWLDPFKNNGSYYNQFPTENKKWTEILDGKDFFDFNEKVDIICSNPPYSIIDRVFKKSVELKPKVISYLIGINNLTTRRIEMMNNAGYGLTLIHFTKVYQWFGMSLIVIFELGKDNCVSFDRIVWR